MSREIGGNKTQAEMHEYRMKIMDMTHILDDDLKKIDREFCDSDEFREALFNLQENFMNLFDEIYRQLKAKYSIGIKLKLHPKINAYKKASTKMKTMDALDYNLSLQEPFLNKACEICGEKRLYNKCHIIPRWHGGMEEIDNIIFLCPTHHSLFDRGLLFKREFKKISLNGKSENAKKFFKEWHLEKHQEFWKNYKR